VSWWRLLRDRDRVERELDTELQYHFDREVADNVRMGMSEQEARRRARLDLGGEDALKERCRDVWGTRWLHDLAQDLRFGCRLLTKDRWFTLPSVLTLALGIGMTGAMFTIVNAASRALSSDKGGRLVSIHPRDAAGRWRGLGVSYPDFRDFQAAARTFEGLAAVSQSAMTLGGDGRAVERVSASYVSAQAFRLLGEKPAMGRDFDIEDDQRGAPAVVLVGHRIWTTRYKADPGIVGRRVQVNGAPATVIGVTSDGFRFPVVSDMWLPLAQMAGLADTPRDARFLQVVGTLAEGASRPQAQAEMAAIAARLSREHPATNADTSAVVVPFPPHFVPDPILIALMSAVGFVLLLACINVANLLLARSVARRRELAVRIALGATRWRIVRQGLVESSIVAAAAGVLGSAFTLGGIRLFRNAVSGITFPYYVQWTADGRVVLFIVVVGIGAALFVGLLPALHASRLAAWRSSRVTEPSTVGLGRRGLSTLLLAVQVALALMLLAGSGFLLRSFIAVYQADSVVDASRVVTMPVALPSERFATRAQRTAAYQVLDERIKAIAGVSATAFANVVPFAGGPSRRLSVAGRPQVSAQAQPLVSYVAIRGSYFDVLRLRLLRGRPFNERDAMPGSEGAIVNQRLATMFFPEDDPIGAQVCLTVQDVREDGSPDCRTIVGLAPSVRQQYFQDIDPVVYVPAPAGAPDFMLMVRADSEPDGLGPLIRAEVAALDPGMPMGALVPLDRAMTQSRWGHRVFGGTLTVFAVIGLLLAAVGLYAMTALAVAQRTRELGIRLALGSRPGDLVWLFTTRAAWTVGCGLVLGLLGALAVGRLLQGFLVGTSPADPVILAGIAVLLTTVSLAAVFVPARRAARCDPLTTLRGE